MISTKRVQISFLAGAIAALASLTGGAAQQSVSATGKIVYESCYADLWWWAVFCDIRIRTESDDIPFVSLGRLPKWSPDGKRFSYIAYGYDYAADFYWSGQVIVANPASPGDSLLLTEDYSSVYGVEWVSNTKLVFGSDRTGYPELYALNDDGSGLVQLTNGIGFTGSFAVAPGGGAIAIALEVAGARDLFRINADGSGLRSLTSNSAYQGGRITWSSDATRLIFDCGSEVCSVNADGSGLSQLTSGGGAGGTLSQAGKLAFARWFETGQEPVVQEVDGRVVRIANGTSGHTPIWSQNGGTVLFQGYEAVAYSGRCYFGGGGHNADDFCVPLTGIYMVNADATGLLMVATGSNPDWRMTIPGEPNASFTGQCDGVSCRFDATASSDPDGGTLTYSWTFGDGTAGSGATPSHAYATGATYTVTLTVSDTHGLTSTVWKTFTANTPPVPAFTYSCSSATCTFDGTRSTDVDGRITSYDWSFGDGQSGYGATVSHRFPTGTFIVRLVAYDNGGAWGMTTASVAVVNPVPIAAFTSSCSGFTCTFNSSGSTDDGPLRFSWIFGDGVIDNSNANPSHRYYAPGTYQVTLTVADVVGQTATFTDTVNVNPERMHVGDLDGTRSQPSRGWWYPTATVTVHGADHRRLLNVLVSGHWSSGEIASCWTDSAGQCFVTGPYVRGNGAPSFTVDNLSHEALAYNASANHDVDGDSNGTTLNVIR